MEILKAYCSAILTIGMLSLCCTQTIEDGNYHTVGDVVGWTTGVNYQNWSRDEQCFVGDSLLFVYDTNHYDVLEVNHNSFDSCDDKNFIMNVTEGEDSLFKLTEAKTYYFISNRDHCLQGDLKVSVAVMAKPVNTPPSRPPQTSMGRGRGLPMVLSLLTIQASGGGLMLVVSARVAAWRV
ncbi:hypothetical protein Vadar_012624 [Vaccinium darrowii]|uniref:Uncharacterized protein n=1 Tax=Vaccinium darrowii TaxID=229202 RepID=A0ACB7YL22_9ERIC|nr:hypothetical protein Vadar_012624 [Vaccinium darrowii]